MSVVFTEPFKRDYENLPFRIQGALDKALQFLVSNTRYSSLRAKKLPGTSVWYARITKEYRFTFQRVDDTIILRRAGTHDILKKERK